MANHTFKIGDIVKVVDNGGTSEATIGDIGKVVELWENNGLPGITIETLECKYRYNQYEFRFELHKQKKKKIKVYNVAKFINNLNKKGE